MPEGLGVVGVPNDRSRPRPGSFPILLQDLGFRIQGSGCFVFYNFYNSFFQPAIQGLGFRIFFLIL